MYAPNEQYPKRAKWEFWEGALGLPEKRFQASGRYYDVAGEVPPKGRRGPGRHPEGGGKFV